MFKPSLTLQTDSSEPLITGLEVTTKRIAVLAFGTAIAVLWVYSLERPADGMLIDVAIEDARRGLTEEQIAAHVAEVNLGLSAWTRVKSAVHLEVIVKGALAASTGH